MDGSAATNRAHASSAVAAMVDFVNRSISDGSWRAGDKLPTERELEKRFGIARNTLRKGMRVLAEQGKIVRHVGRGTFVTRSTMNDAGHGAVSLEHDGRDLVRRIHGASPVEIMEIRILIEPPVIELAATRATAGDLTEMMECLGRGEAAETVAEFEQWDGKFHVKILEAARNQLLTDIYQAINGARRQAEWGTLKERILTPDRRQAAQNEHRRIFAALRQRDAAKARAEMHAHLVHVRDSLLGLW